MGQVLGLGVGARPWGGKGAAKRASVWGCGAELAVRK